jgi:photosystem II stability/assembly factor-like uncharacterized protein
MTPESNEEKTEDIVHLLAAPHGYDPYQTPTGPCFAARSAGLFASRDGAKSWHNLFSSLGLQEPLAALTVAVSPGFDRDHTLFVGVPGGILRSTDEGATWEVFTFPTPPPVFSSIVLSTHYPQDGVAFASTTEDGVYRSEDHGRLWSPSNFGLLDLQAYCMAISPDFANDEMLLIGCESGIFRSTNGGRAWREVNLQLGYVSVFHLEISPDFHDDKMIFAGTDGQGLLISTDGGDNWVPSGDIADPVDAIVLEKDFQNNDSLFVLTNGQILLSQDRGKSFTAWEPGASEAGLITAICAPQGFTSGRPVLLGLQGGSVKVISG